MDITKSAATNDSMPATAELGTTSTTSLVQWTAIPVLPSRGQPHGKNLGVEHQLDEKDALVLCRHAEKISKICDRVNRTTTTGIIEVGAEFAAVQALLAGKGRDGTFRPWCKSLGFSRSSVYRAIAAHAAFGKCPTVGHFFEPKAVYLLAAESCPAEARAEALQLAEQGKHVGCDLAKQIVAQFVPKTTTNGKRRTRQLDVKVEQAPKITTEIKQLEHRPEVEKPAEQVAAETTSGTGAATAGDIAAAAADPPVSTADSSVITTDAERQTGLAGLQAVIAALEDKGLYDEYREVLERIRVALEGLVGQEDESEEITECTY
jgi:hypothetical protein